MNAQGITLIIADLAAFTVAGSERDSIEIKPIDCGPLAPVEFGVIFAADTNARRQTYFTKGKAGYICPKILAKKVIKGRELDLCQSYKPEDLNECNSIKEFVIDE